MPYVKSSRGAVASQYNLAHLYILSFPDIGLTHGRPRTNECLTAKISSIVLLSIFADSQQLRRRKTLKGLWG